MGEIDLIVRLLHFEEFFLVISGQVRHHSHLDHQFLLDSLVLVKVDHEL